MANSSQFQTEVPGATLQQQFAKKFSHLLSTPPQSAGPKNPYWQYSHGFDSPLPSTTPGGHCSTNSSDYSPVKTLTFPKSVKKRKNKKKESGGKKPKTKGGKKPKTKSGGKVTKKPKTGGKKDKKKPTKKVQALTKFLKLIS